MRERKRNKKKTANNNDRDDDNNNNNNNNRNSNSNSKTKKYILRTCISGIHHFESFRTTVAYEPGLNPSNFNRTMYICYRL